MTMTGTKQGLENNEAMLLITTFLPAKDVLSLLSTSPSLRSLGNSSAQFWQTLQQLHYGGDSGGTGATELLLPANDMTTTAATTVTTAAATAAAAAVAATSTAKANYLLRAHCNDLAVVRWHRIHFEEHRMDDREGHLGCRLGQHMIMTGGFVRDPTVYIRRIHGDNNHNHNNHGQPPPPPPQQQWTAATPPPQQPEPPWVYGATLTPLSDGRRAVRFGGFASGGYSDETSHVSKNYEMMALHGCLLVDGCCSVCIYLY
jgi:hypothetical protein